MFSTIDLVNSKDVFHSARGAHCPIVTARNQIGEKESGTISGMGTIEGTAIS